MHILVSVQITQICLLHPAEFRTGVLQCCWDAFRNEERVTTMNLLRTQFFKIAHTDDQRSGTEQNAEVGSRLQGRESRGLNASVG